MLSERLEGIKKHLVDKSKSESVLKEIEKLMKSDVITPRLLARKTKVTSLEATRVLDFLVKENELEFFIIVECINPEIKYFNEINHYKHFNSLSEFNEFTKNPSCSICGCGYKYDFENAKIGFKRSGK
jgi:hypothetical protein